MTLPGILMEVSLEQLSKARLPIDVTFPEILMEVSPEQLAKALLPIDVTLLPIVRDISLRCPAKGDSVTIFRPRYTVTNWQ